MKKGLLSLCACLWASVAASGAAGAGDLELSGVGGPAVSSREGDGALLSAGRLGLRFSEHLTVSALGLGGYAAGRAPAVPLEDGEAAAPSPSRRVLGGLGVDLQLSLPLGRLRPFVRGGLLHQQERALSASLDDPLGTALGTAKDARRRTGLVAGAGGALLLWRHAGAELFATGELTALMFADERGPRAYLAAMAGLGAAFDLQIEK